MIHTETVNGLPTLVLREGTRKVSAASVRYIDALLSQGGRLPRGTCKHLRALIEYRKGSEA